MSSDFTFTSSKSRKLKDRLAKYSISIGGMMVLVALLLIFFYLLYVVAPIFKSAKLEGVNSFGLVGEGKTLALGMEEQAEIGFRFSDDLSLQYFFLQDDPFKGQSKGTLIQSHQLIADKQYASFAQSSPVNRLYAYGFQSGEIIIVRPTFAVSFPNNIRRITPDIEFVTGQEPISIDVEYVTGNTPVVIDEHAQALTKLAIERNEESIGIAAYTAEGRLIYSRMTGEENFMADEIEWEAESVVLEGISKKVDEIKIASDLSSLFVRAGNQLTIYDIRDIEDVELKQQLDVNAAGANATSLALLSGASSVLIGNDNGEISQWFEVTSDQGRAYVNARSFMNSSAVNQIVPEFYRKSFFTVGEQGQVGLFFTTSEAELFNGSLLDYTIDGFAISPRSNNALIESNGSLFVYKVENEHPEVTWSALWEEVWYEGYPEPDYTWQSTSADDDFESKFSLVPISFGTIKAAFYAMLFAVPIALSAAIYTAYFMTPGLRKVVKPTVEIMEALPTVILGFLAGLWLAPLIESHLPGIVAMLLMLPLSILLTAYGWHKMPKSMRERLPEGWDSILLVPVVMGVGYFSFAMSPLLETWFFGGDTRLFITNDLGITFDQRNSLVVGIAMGFAVIPTIFSIAEDAIFSVPKHLSNGSLALGATSWQTLTRVVLLTASPGIFSAVMMGLGRAVGETMIVLMATGNTPIMDWSIFQGMRTLSANIAVEMPESEVGSSHYRILFLAAFVLFIFTFMFNTVAEFVRQRLREKYSSL